MWDLKKNPPETMDVAFLFWNHKKIGQHLLPLKVPHRKIEFGIVFMFLYLFIHSLIHIFEKKASIYFHSKCVTATLNFELIYLNVYFDCYFFLSFIIWFILNTGMTFLFWNHSIIAQHVFTSTQSASPRDWVLNCIYVSLFIHSFIHLFIFFLLLFICFTLFNLH